MKREFEFDQRVERSILTTYRKELWKPFILAVKRYELIQEGDKIAVCISGGKDSMLMAKLMQELQRHSDGSRLQRNQPLQDRTERRAAECADHDFRDGCIRRGQ